MGPVLYGYSMSAIRAILDEHETMQPLRETPAYVEMLRNAHVQAAEKELEAAKLKLAKAREEQTK